uniref:Protocadherin gamma-C3 n=1 Tax=Sinocyclocheilus rhinocerous TaxID=307959 RepID=A0A673GBL1_9TELE
TQSPPCCARRRSWPVLCLALSLMHLSIASGELRYSVLEEQKPGSVVGNIARDLGLSAMRITERNLQVVSGSNAQYFEVNPNGVLVIRETIDRESICALSSTCSLHLQILLQNPLEIHRILVQIDDVNDNVPQFPNVNSSLEISEAAAAGTRFRLESARDPDVGINSLRTYSISSSDYFVLNVETKSDGSKFPELVLEKALDRESQDAFRLSLRAVDGGQPEKSGTTLLLIKILDVNDNAPVFDEPVKRVSLLENSPPRTLVTKLNATDVDSGINGKISYLFSKYTPERTLKMFSVDSQSGEIRVVGDVDYEEANVYDITVQARDGGSPAMEGSLEIIDVNDNTPEVTLTSLTSPIREDAETGTVIALISAKDLDSGDNGKVTLRVSQVLPFKLKSAFGEHYTLVTDGRLDREVIDEYTVVVTATDSGSPPLSSQKTFAVRLSDVNDNAPVFSQNSYSVDVAENNAPGTPIVAISASDPDVGDNARLSYSILPTTIHGSPISSYVYINPENGNIFTMRSLDYEQINAFKIEVQVRDAGAPPQTSNVTVHVFVVDQNDNPPIILYPTHSEDAGLQLTVLHGAPVGHRVNKIVAVDPDSGHNAWLFYSIAPGDDSSLFHIEPHTGELRTAQKLMDDEQGGKTHPAYNIIVVVRDNGQPALSTSVSVTVTVEEKSADKSTDFRITPHKGTGMTDITLYLIISLGCVSLVSLLTMAVLLVRCISLLFSWFGHMLRPQGHTDGHHRIQDTHLHHFSVPMAIQKPPSADWRFTQNQRPGPSGSCVKSSPNHLTENSLLSAEVSEATNTLAPGTMGLSTRYNPQFTLQHVPDYRQNVYIPGSTATLTSNQQQPQQALPPPQAAIAAAAAQPEPPKAAQTPASKKKSTKKEKK